MVMSRVEKFFVNSAGRQRSRVAQAKRLLADVPLGDARRYLEIGCGAGAVTRYVASVLNIEATGIDIDRDQVQRPRRDAAGIVGVTFLEADAGRLPFEDGAFDVVLSFMATHHIADVFRALSEIARVLRPGGHFVYADLFLPPLAARVGALAGHGYSLPRSDRMVEMPVLGSHRGGERVDRPAVQG